MTTIIVPLYGYLKSKIKGFLSLARIAKERRLNFSNQDVVGANLIALDPVKRKLLYMRKPGASSCLIIDLKDLEDCSLTKQYSNINAGDLSKRKMSHFLKSIFLNLRFRNGSASVTLPFYEGQNDFKNNVEQLEAKAKKWETIVSNLSNPRLERA